MKILFSTMYGSRLYGTFLPESDYDRKNVILPDLDDLLLGKSPKNVVKKSEAGDEEFVPLQVFAKDFLEGQTYALELAYAVKYDKAEQVVYDDRFYDFCEELRSKFLTSTMHSMVRYAVNQANLYSNKGERLNAAKDLSSLLESFEYDWKISDINEFYFTELSERYPDHIQITEYDQDGKGSIRPCLKILTRVIPFTNSVLTAKGTVDRIIDKYGKRAEAASGDNVDWKALSHALRIINSGIHLLQRKNIVFPYDNIEANFYREVRKGKYDFKYISTIIEIQMDLLQKMETESDLPKLTPELRKDQEEWLLGWLKVFYSL